MDSAEPLERSALHPIPPVALPTPESEEWRAEVASRVHSYRARQKNRVAEQQSLGFPPQNAGSVGGPITRATGEMTATHSEGAGTSRERVFAKPGAKPDESVPGAFDTNYYRRLNALEQSVRLEAAAAAPDNSAGEDGAQQASEAGERPGLTAGCEFAIDLELHAPGAGDACLERYRIHDDATPGACAITAEPHPAPLQQDDTIAPLLPPVGGGGSLAPSQPASVDSAPAPAASAPHEKLRIFPRPLLEPPLWALPSRDELADPVSRPRILEVPEDIMPAVQGSLFPAIRLDAEEPEPSARRTKEIEVPLPVAPLSTRLKAGLADLAVVASGGGVFGAIAARAMPELGTKPFAAVVAVATVLLWAAYQQMFLLYAGRTPGMRMTGIRLSTFDGRTPQWSERRSRARYLLTSCASVGLGFLWALLDEDRLCWHDRASRTFPTRS